MLDGTGDDTARSALRRLAAKPFFGRRSVLAEAKEALDATRSGRGQSLLLVGESGIGKTRLADEVVGFAQTMGIRPLLARCHELDGAPALWPWLQIARQVLSALDPGDRAHFLSGEGSPLAELLSEFGRHAQTAPGHALRDRYAVFEAVTSLVRCAAVETPLLIVLDDLHWADAASILLARYATRELRREPIVFLGLHRDTDVDPDDPLAEALGDLGRESEVVRIEGLTEDEVLLFVEHVAGFHVSPALLAALHAQTGGNPFFLAEILRLLASENRLGAPDAPMPEPIPLPQSVRTTLERRLEGLSEGAQELLRQAGVVGREFDREVLEAAMASSRDLGPLLDEALASRLIEPVPGASLRFRFIHNLVCETLDAATSSSERSRLHRCAGDAILRTRSARIEEHYVALAVHYLESAGVGRAQEAVDYAVLGAERAASSYSFELAARLLRQALRALDVVDAGEGEEDTRARRGDILVRLGDALWSSGRRDEAQKVDRAAVEIARHLGNASLFARAAIGLAGRDDLPMDLPGAPVRLLEEALEALPASDARLRVRLLAHLVRATSYGEDRKRLIAWAEEANAIAARLDDPGALFAARESLHYALLLPRHLEERLAVSAELPGLARHAGSLRLEALAWLWRVFDLILVPDIQATDGAIARFERIARTLRQPLFEWLSLGLRASRAQMDGHLDRAERLVFKAFEAGQRAETPNALLFFGTQLFHLREEQGRLDELLPVMQKIVDEHPGLPVFRIGIPLIHTRADREEEARRTFEQVAARDFADVPRDLHRIPMLTSAATVAAYLGDTRRAEILLKELHAHEGRIVMGGVVTYWGGAVDRSLGQLEEALGRLDEADRHYAAAADLAARAGAALLEAHSLVERARVLRRQATRASVAEAERIESRSRALYGERGLDESPAVSVPAVQRHRPPFPFPPPRATSRSGLFRGEDSAWTLEYEHSRIELPDSKGLFYLQQLLAHPDQDIHVLDLVAIDAPPASSVRAETAAAATDDAPARLVESEIEALDPEAGRAYRGRLRELSTQRAQAERARDAERLAEIDRECDQIETELARAFALGGRRRKGTDAAERARKAVYNRIRSAIRRIADVHPTLGRHLERSVRTGTICTYRPEIPVEWRID